MVAGQMGDGQWCGQWWTGIDIHSKGRLPAWGTIWCDPGAARCGRAASRLARGARPDRCDRRRARCVAARRTVRAREDAAVERLHALLPPDEAIELRLRLSPSAKAGSTRFLLLAEGQVRDALRELPADDPVRAEVEAFAPRWRQFASPLAHRAPFEQARLSGLRTLRDEVPEGAARVGDPPREDLEVVALREWQDSTYVTAELAAMRRWWLASLGAFCTLFVVMVLFALRAHYTMDVFTGLIAALLAIWMASDIAAYLDRRRALVPRASTVNLSESG